MGHLRKIPVTEFIYLVKENTIYCNCCHLSKPFHCCYLVKVHVFGSLVVTFVTIRLLGPRFEPQPGKKFGSGFLLHPLLETSLQEPKMEPVPIPSPDTKRGLVAGVQITPP